MDAIAESMLHFSGQAGVEGIMLKKMGLAAAAFGAMGAVPAFADDSCQAPPVPPSVDGATATRDQLVAAVNAAKSYISASDAYQQCIGDYIAAQKADAAKNKTTFDPAIEQAETAKVDANQASKQRVGDAVNAAVGAYKSAHPN